MRFFGRRKQRALPAATVRPGIYREPVSQVHLVGRSVIQDNGYLQGTGPGSTGYYLFSEVGAGVKALALVGHKSQVFSWLDEHAHSGIENRIVELPEIYMGVQPYRPGSRFVGLFPVQAAVGAITEGIAAFAPGSTLTDLVGAIGDIRGASDYVRGHGMEITTSSGVPKMDYTGILYIRFSYLGGPHMHQIATGTVDFPDVKALLETLLN